MLPQGLCLPETLILTLKASQDFANPSCSMSLHNIPKSSNNPFEKSILGRVTSKLLILGEVMGVLLHTRKFISRLKLMFSLFTGR